jgi:bifunctional UDP-N-acetylglucosamine pyrophosphorylase/glucosamine-1-phosphate N-acetyltransferase
MRTTAIILAAGKGTRMRSELPKVLHTVGGLPMIHHVVAAAKAAGASEIVVVIGHGAQAVRDSVTARFGTDGIVFAHQREQRGTGHAARVGLSRARAARGDVLLLVGDMPLLRASTLNALLDARRRPGTRIVVGTLVLPDAGTYGRIVRDEQGRVVRVVEARDASPEEHALREINTGLYCVDASFLREALSRLRPNNAQRELYLTDIVAHAGTRRRGAHGLELHDPAELQGINTHADLAQAERDYHARRAHELLLQGVRVADPTRLRIHADVTVARGAVVGDGAALLGRTRVAENAVIGPGAIVRDASIGDGAFVGPYAVIHGADIAAGANIAAHAVLGPMPAGPFAWI